MLREHFAVQSRQGMEKVDCTEQAGHGKGRLLGKDDIDQILFIYG